MNNPNIDILEQVSGKSRWAVMQWAIDLQATTDRRLKLLKWWNDERVVRGTSCNFCRVLPDITKVTMLNNEYRDNHADDCELKKELDDN